MSRKSSRTSRRRRRETYFPKRNRVVALLRNRPETVYADELGRLYGFVEEGPILEGLERKGEVDREVGGGRKLMWVHLPHAEKGPFAKVHRTRDDDGIERDDLLLLPTDRDGYLNLRNYQTREDAFIAKISYYAERVPRAQMGGSVVVDLFIPIE